MNNLHALLLMTLKTNKLRLEMEPVTCDNKMMFISKPGVRFSKLPVITGPVKLFCFPFQMGVSKVLTIVQESYQLNKQNELC